MIMIILPKLKRFYWLCFFGIVNSIKEWKICATWSTKKKKKKKKDPAVCNYFGNYFFTTFQPIYSPIFVNWHIDYKKSVEGSKLNQDKFYLKMPGEDIRNIMCKKKNKIK